tara:strand:+ start:504 stop:773 length:270 start_codon:yes stop_codon:yes gene_type:complete
MIDFISRLNFKKYLDNFLLLNLFIVIFSAFFFMFSLIMEINGRSIFLDFFRRIWEPFILPTITILISSILFIAIISWLKKKLLPEEKDI